MHYVMFDIDGTLIESYQFDSDCFVAAIKEVTGLSVNSNWERYPHATDRGILMTLIERQLPQYDLASLEQQVKAVFIRNIKQHISDNPVREIAGARKFMTQLLDSDLFTVSLATGGWGETALLKLQSAGFDTSRLQLSSSNDHHARTEIMKIARRQVGEVGEGALTYFGDAQWDVNACLALGVNLVIIGNRVEHHQQLPNYLDVDAALRFVTENERS
ncbi:HAD family hydrolase [Photobacterium sp. TY1-4]|uniref:HAD family hydrolase n=1 Tax=Photobacterium sp. TY1-4 TaxID=2899122 RepID=UPI0021BE8920|nr:HAD hydrolase-like protein [Photobacterium sp. TY1-4]UXI03088.1 HAD hydrolase-like protein [Photobacterium sp. TY1-4]